jgi:hypothetical protein
MPSDRSFIELNRASTNRIRVLATRLSDTEMQTRVGEHWTIAIVFAHLAFLDRRALYVLDETERAGKVINPDFDIFVNDLALPLWAAIPPREAARICLETAEVLDKRLETYPPDLLEMIRAVRERYLFRAYHRNEHLDEAEAALNSRSKKPL